MLVEVVDNVARKTARVLTSAIQASDDVRVAVAFVSRSGLRELEPALSVAIAAGSHLEFLVGLDMRTTEPEALRALYALSTAHTDVHLYCYASGDPAAVYHPKMYLLRSGDEAVAVVGSSNLTAGGLRHNVEVNVVIRATVSDEAVSDAYSGYNRLKFDRNRVIPDDDFLELYAKLCMSDREQRRRALRERSAEALRSEFERKAESLRRPVPTRRDLVGWPAAVYDLLPDGPFRTSSLYRYEALLRERYPRNLNVRAKIRQQLQVLRDMGLLSHVATGTWRKSR
jgi:HKD family nuclease